MCGRIVKLKDYKGKELPDELKAKLPANKTTVLKGTVIALSTYEDVKVEGGKYRSCGGR